MAAALAAERQPSPEEEIIVRFRFIRCSFGSLCAASSLALAVGACGDTKPAKQVVPEPIAAVEPVPVVPVEPAVVPPVAPVEVVAPAPVVELPKTYGGLIEHGKKLVTEGKLDDALVVFEKARDMKPAYGMAYIELARLHLDKKEIERARELAEDAIELAPDSSYAWNTMGRVELAEGDLDAAATSFERAAEENPDNGYAWNNLGYVRIQQRDFEAAAEALERATSGVEVTAYMWNNLGMTYEHLDRIVEARAAYAKAAEHGSPLAGGHLARLEGVTSIGSVAEKTDVAEMTEVETDGGDEGGVIEGIE
jgi:tetratricopeptide (TPR) repeat protein